MHSLHRSIALIGLATCGAAASATYTVSASMDGSQEVTPKATPAVGSMTGSYDETTNELWLSMSYSGLLGSYRASHIHKAPFGVNGGVIHDFADFGSWSGTGSSEVYTQTSPIVLSDDNEAALLSGGLYINIHSTTFPTGEIRGQISAVPEPATMAALAAGVVALAARRRRK